MDNLKLKNLIIAFLFLLPSVIYAQIYAVQPEPAAARDAFSRIRVSEPFGVFDGQFQYGLNPLLYDTITIGSGATITYDATNRNADLKFSSSPSASEVVMQTFEYFRYQAGKSQQIFVTFNMHGAHANIIKYAGYSDGNNGIELFLNGTTANFRILSDTQEGDETVPSGNWNIDKFDGTGPSGLTIDFTKVQILVVDFQALYVGRVRVGFDIDGIVYYAHEFLHANNDTYSYFQTANLPVRVGMYAGATATDSLDFICSAVISEGGQEDPSSYTFSVEGTVTAGSGTDTYIVGIQPDTLFGGFVNRTKLVLESVDVVVTGNSPVLYKVGIGQALTGATATEINNYCPADAVSGTLSGTPAIVLAQGYCAATSQNKSAISRPVSLRYPITLGHDGQPRDLGRITVTVNGVGGTSATRCVLNFKVTY